MQEQPIILFDGICNFCDSAVNFLIRNDKKNRIRFAALQSDPGQLLLKQNNLSTTSFDTFVLIDKGKTYTRSTAALRVCRYLTGGWPIFYGFIIVPAFIRDMLYNLVAQNRYRWFGKKESCMIPDASVRQRFL
jgi:predicted DCC family thiol-disulfide oxidoreductase YuxK